jgi:hypothetical protein
VIGPNEGRPRASLDSRTFNLYPRSSNTFARPPPVPVVPSTKEEDFEDVGLEDAKPAPQQPKKRGLFARLTESSSENQATAGADGVKTEKWHFGGRKRGQSGQGAELGSISRPETPKSEGSNLRRSETPKPVENVQAPKATAITPDASTARRSEAPKLVETVPAPATTTTPKTDAGNVRKTNTPKPAEAIQPATLTPTTTGASKPRSSETSKPVESAQAPMITTTTIETS